MTQFGKNEKILLFPNLNSSDQNFGQILNSSFAHFICSHVSSGLTPPVGEVAPTVTSTILSIAHCICTLGVVYICSFYLLFSGLTLLVGEVAPTVTSMILSSAAFNLQDGAPAQMGIFMTLPKGFSFSYQNGQNGQRLKNVVGRKKHFQREDFFLLEYFCSQSTEHC